MSSQPHTKKTYDQHLSEHKLMGSQCAECQALYLPPRPMCKACFSTEMDWVQLPENGKLTAFTVIHIAPTAMLESGYGRDNPYISGIVELENGLAISAQILGFDPSHPEEIKIGTTVEAEFIERGEGEDKKTFLSFRAK